MQKVLIASLTLFALTAAAATIPVAVGPAMSFSPASVSVAPGDTVQWNFANFHTTTSDLQSGPEVWDSGFQSSGSFSHTFNTPGDYLYYCAIHSSPGGTGMNGVVHVVAATPAPSISTISPQFTPANQAGATLTLTGTNFIAPCSISVGSNALTTSTPSTTTATATLVAMPAGTATVTLSCSNGTATSSITFLAPPTVSSLSPASGLAGSIVTISGSGFVSGTRVQFNGVDATNVVLTSSNSISAMVPSVNPGSYAVTLLNPDGQSASAGSFVVLPATSIPTFDPRLLALLAAAIALIGTMAARLR